MTCRNCPDKRVEWLLTTLAFGYGLLLVCFPHILFAPPYDAATQMRVMRPYYFGVLFLLLGLGPLSSLLSSHCWARKWWAMAHCSMWFVVCSWYFTAGIHPLGLWGAMVNCVHAGWAFALLYSHVHDQQRTTASAGAHDGHPAAP